MDLDREDGVEFVEDATISLTGTEDNRRLGGLRHETASKNLSNCEKAKKGYILYQLR